MVELLELIAWLIGAIPILIIGWVMVAREWMNANRGYAGLEK